jgi:hypothetical protein
MRPITAGGNPSAASGNWFPAAAEEREPMRQIACEGLTQINDPKYKTMTETAVKKRSMGDTHIVSVYYIYKFTVFCSETFLGNISYRKKENKKERTEVEEL